MTITATAVRPLSRAEVEYLREQLARDLAFATSQEADTVGGDEWLCWKSRRAALESTLHTLDYLCGSEPWYEPESVAPTA